MSSIPKLSEMEHFTSEEFGTNLDQILDRVCAENTAFVIDSKRLSYVLCPASWFEPLSMVQTEALLRSSLRYLAISEDAPQDDTIDAAKQVIQELPPDKIRQILTELDSSFKAAKPDIVGRWHHLRCTLFAGIQDEGNAT